MKKILLTLSVGFCFVGVAVAQEPAKVAKKKQASLTTASQEGKPATPEMIKAKEADFKANHSGKSTPAPAAPAAKAADLTSDRKN
ncbi:MAG: hypothetical protein EOO06_15385 [Chitinophagaceae bacterium]|nr:MAG: hypothetical protein EOO06_15385 [Chitinophagaceae bacterium]